MRLYQSESTCNRSEFTSHHGCRREDNRREFPCLWEVSSKAYKDAIAIGNAWKEVSNKVTTHTRVFLARNG